MKFTAIRHSFISYMADCQTPIISTIISTFVQSGHSQFKHDTTKIIFSLQFGKIFNRLMSTKQKLTPKNVSGEILDVPLLPVDSRHFWRNSRVPVRHLKDETHEENAEECEPIAWYSRQRLTTGIRSVYRVTAR